MSTRRTFVKVSLSAAAALSFPRRVTALSARTTPAPLRILILGGTNFIGPYQVRYAMARGHSVAVFNRGRRQADLPAGVEYLRGDRNEANGLAALRGRNWDVVFDNPTTFPRWVRDAGAVLKDATRHFIFTSTISVYPDQGTPVGADENAPLARYTGADAFAETRITNENYGPLKALAEQEALRQFPEKTTIVRPGLIVGPGDATDRFTYWPVRIEKGGEVLAPGDGQDAMQYVDVRDLAEWMIRLAEQRVFGTFNATGPRARLSSAECLYGIRAAIDGSTDVRFTWVPADFLATQNVQPWGDMPVWIPRSLPDGAITQVSVARAVEAGLTFRPLAATVADTLAWFKAQPVERQGQLRAGLKAEREAEVLAAWKRSRPQE